MSYQVLARRCRPETFEEVIGQPHATRTLQNAIRLGRIAHAYLFSGARGVGKTSVARIMAKALNCEKGPTPVPCNQCSNCREISHTNSVDVLEIDGASNRGIDSIRELRETARYRPAKGRYKVYIIDEVHQLSTDAFNALLKILEEPPAHVIFIFATTEPHKIPATVLSRCQRFDFRRLSLQLIVAHLKKIVSEEGAEFSESLLYAIASEADGSMRDAQSLLEQLLAFSADDLPESEILDILGVIDRQSVMRAAEAIISGKGLACLELAADVYRRGLDSRRFCQHLCDHFRNLLFVSFSAGGEARIDLPGDEKELLRELAAKTTPEALHVYFQMLLRGEEDIRRSSMPKIVLEMLLLRMAGLPRMESLDVLLERLSTLEQSLKTGQPAIDCIMSESRPGFVAREPGPKSEHKGEPKAVVPVLTAEPERPVSRDPGTPEAMALPDDAAPLTHSQTSPPSAAKAIENWQMFVRFLENHNPILWAKVSHCSVKVSGEVLELEVPEMFESSANGPEFMKSLEEASLAFFGAKLQWTITKKPSATSRGPAARAGKTGKISGAKQIAAHPAVQRAIEILGAELVEVKTPEGGPRERRGK
ncbi:MAG: DNA polymerase III subunit gamma/tau [Syntrophobacteraceae bacterium]|nr:DNA polymerase III subunit gamma/tau [Syntrophobacteraceae bacterium]